eukprot:scpid25108/ scgid8484/ 
MTKQGARRQEMMSERKTIYCQGDKILQVIQKLYALDQKLGKNIQKIAVTRIKKKKIVNWLGVADTAQYPRLEQRQSPHWDDVAEAAAAEQETIPPPPPPASANK